jgi:tetratricopeptide (TPR) repeat protein
MTKTLIARLVLATLTTCLAVNPAAAQTATADSSFAQRYNAGQTAMAQGRYDEARADFEQLEKADASIAEVHAALGVLNYKLGSFDRAIEEIRAARKLKPALHGLDALLALSLAEAGRSREALSGLEQAFRSAPDPAVKRQAGLELTRVYTHLDMDRKAVEVALELRDRYKDDPEVLYEAGNILGNSAYVTMQQLFHNPGSEASVWAQLAEGEAYESQGQTASAIQKYRRVLDLDPHRSNIHYRIGRTYLRQWETSHADEDRAAAADEFTKEIDADPQSANAAYELAGLRWKDGNNAEAQRLYELAIEHYPDFEEAQVGLAGVLLDEQQASQAVQHLEKAVTLRPGDEVAWYRLARGERLMGDAQAQKHAVETFQKLHAQSVASQNSTLRAQSPDAVTPQQLGAESLPQ